MMDLRSVIVSHGCGPLCPVGPALADRGGRGTDLGFTGSRPCLGKLQDTPVAERPAGLEGAVEAHELSRGCLEQWSPTNLRDGQSSN